MKKNRWAIAVTILVVVAVAAIGGIVFYGTVLLPKDRLAADNKACTSFAEGVATARNKVIAEGQQNQSVTDAELAQIYLDEVDKGIDKAFNEAASKSDVSNALAQLGFQRISYDATQGFNAISALEQGYQTITDACQAVLPAASATPTPTN